VTLETSYREISTDTTRKHPLHSMHQRNFICGQSSPRDTSPRRVTSRRVALRRVASRCVAPRCVALHRIKWRPLDTRMCVYIYISHVRIPLCNRPLYRANPTAAGRSNAVGCRTTHRAEVDQTNACASERAAVPRLVIKGNDRQWNY